MMWEFLGWVVAVCVAVFLVVLTVAAVVAMVRSIRDQGRPKSTSRKVL